MKSIVNFQKFLLESKQIKKHPLEEMANTRNPGEKVPREFAELFYEDLPHSLIHIGNLDGTISHEGTLTLVISVKPNIHEILKKNLVDSTSTARFLVALDDNILGETWEETSRNIKTMKAWLPDPGNDVIKMGAEWGYKPTYTFVTLTQYVNDTYVLYVTFVPDEEIASKYKGKIQGRKFGL